MIFHFAFFSFVFSLFSLNLWGIKVPFYVYIVAGESFSSSVLGTAIEGENERGKRFKWWNILWYCDENRKGGIFWGGLWKNKYFILFSEQIFAIVSRDEEERWQNDVGALRFATPKELLLAALDNSNISFYFSAFSPKSIPMNQPKWIKHSRSFREKMKLQVLRNKRWWKTFCIITLFIRLGIARLWRHLVI